MINTLRAIIAIMALIVLSLLLIPVQIVCNAANMPMKRHLPVLWHRLAARWIGLKVIRTGEIAPHRPLLIVANHVSWLDIVSLGFCGPLSFIAKSEVARWPAFGWLAKLQRTVFVVRERRSETASKADEIALRLRAKDVMVLFAEGTSSAGIHVLPFRSALLGAAQKAAGTDGVVWVQPVALAYTGLCGMPTTMADRPFSGFYGDMDMAPHLWAVLKRGALDVHVRFGEPVPMRADSDRKALTRALEEAVRRMKTGALREF